MSGQRTFLSTVLLSLIGLLLLCWPALAEEFKVTYTADKVEYLKEEDAFRLIGNVNLKIRSEEREKKERAKGKKDEEIGWDYTIITQQIDYDTKNKILKSDQVFEMVHTPFEESGRTIKGSSFLYDVNLKRIDAKNVYLTQPAELPNQKVYILGDEMTAYQDGQRIVMRHGFYTTCDHLETQLPELGNTPANRDTLLRRTVHYAIKAEVMDFIQNDRVIAWNTTLVTLENDAFWFPYWYVPLTADFSMFGLFALLLDTGQNPVEGIYTKFNLPYRINEYHDGVVYASIMEKKGYGLGIQHDWIAAPNSITRFFFYGIPVQGDILSSWGNIFTVPTDAEILEQLQIQQELSTGKSGFERWLSNKFKDYQFDVHHKQLLLPHTELDLQYKDIDFYGIVPGLATRNTQRAWNMMITDNQMIAVDPFSDLKIDTNLKLSQSNTSPVTQRVDLANSNLIETTQISINENRNATINMGLDKSTLNLNTNWQNQTSGSSQKTTPLANAVPVSPSASPDSSLLQQNTQNRNGSENWNSTLALRTQIDEQTSLETNLTYNSNLSSTSTLNPQGNLTQTLQPKLTLNQNQNWGSVRLYYEDFFDFKPNLNNPIRQVKRLPELNLNFNPLFQESFPIQFSSVIGRYLDPAVALVPGEINEIARSVFKLGLGSKIHDLGLGNKLNFSGTSFEQRFYQTLDAEYIFTGQVNWRNDLSPYFIPNLTYQRAVQDEENNNSPFQNLDSLGLRTLNRLDVNLGLVNLPEFTMNLLGGYDYQNRIYQPIRANFTSQIGNRFTVQGQTGYSPVNISDAQVGLPLLDIDRNEYKDPHTGATQLVRLEQVGSFVPIGGRWENTTLGIRWRSTDEPLPIGNLLTFGLDEGIPQGIELGSYIAYDFHQGRVNNLSGLMRFKVGDNWWWHTEIDLEATVLPVSVADIEARQWAALEIPFKLTVRKDLHDFVLTASWDSYYQQFNLNVSLLAFPEASQKVLSNVTSLDQQLQNQAGQLQNQVGQF